MMGQQQTVAGSTLARRMVLALAIAAVMALLVMALAVPAFAASQKGNQIGNQTSGLNTSPYYGPGFGGREVTAEAAKPSADPQDPPGVGDIARSSHP